MVRDGGIEPPALAWKASVLAVIQIPRTTEVIIPYVLQSHMLNNFAFLGLSPALSVIVIIVLALIFIFEVWMLISAITNKAISGTSKGLWILGMLLLHPFVAIAYYFTDYKKVA